MVLGMSLAAFTLVHVAISLIAIVSGIAVMIGMLGAHRLPSLTAIFLLFTILTSATGFLFPVAQLMTSHVIGIISLVLLALACIALYGQKLAGAWRWTYVVTALPSLYLNVFVLVIQGFLKIPALRRTDFCGLATLQAASRNGVKWGRRQRRSGLAQRSEMRPHSPGNVMGDWRLIAS
jgi:hypothetical protein